MPKLPESADRLRNAVARAAARAGRDPAEVTVVAVSKERSVEEVLQAFALGFGDFGENYVAEAVEKREEFELLADPARAPAQVRWHLIGRLQSNKAARAATAFDWVHSLDSARTGQLLAMRAARAGRTIQGLVQVNLVGDGRTGCHPDDLGRLLNELSGRPGLRVVGLMTVTAALAPLDERRGQFRALRELRDRHRTRHPDLVHLSMGMSEDFEVAIEEGATLVRVGTALFGPRPHARPE